jgi:hypothetical protein
MICGVTLAICFLHWPQWGGMFCGPKVRMRWVQLDRLPAAAHVFCSKSAQSTTVWGCKT